MTTASAASLAAAAALLLACAAEEQDAVIDDASMGDGGRSLSLGGTAAGRAGAAAGGGQTAHAGQASSSAGTSSRGGSGGAGGSSAGTAGGGGKASAGGTAGNGGFAGTGGSAGSAGTAGGGGALGSGGQAGGPNQPVTCDEATATLLASMSSNVTVASNACLKMALPADQTWIKKITLQPEAGTYPLPFSWSNCGTNSTGAFTANYGNVVLNPVTAECPIFVKLAGSGAPINVQWWGG